MRGEQGFCITQPQPRVTGCESSVPQKCGEKGERLLGLRQNELHGELELKITDTEIIILVKQRSLDSLEAGKSLSRAVQKAEDQEGSLGGSQEERAQEQPHGQARHYGTGTSS